MVQPTAEHVSRLLSQATPGPWRLSLDKATITQTNHLTRDVWTLPRTPADLALMAEVREIGEAYLQLLHAHGELLRALTEQRGPAAPGQTVVHKRGCTYTVLARLLADAAWSEGEQVSVNGQDATVTDDIVTGEQVVLYRGNASGHCWLRPASLFDEHGRFTQEADPATHHERGAE